MTRIMSLNFCLLAALGMFLSFAGEAAAAPLTLNLVPADSHITLNALFSGLPTLAQEGTAGTSDLVLGSPSNRTTFQGTVTVDVDNRLAPTSLQIVSSSAIADSSGTWLPQVRPYQDLDGDMDPGEFGLPPEGDSEVGTNNNFSPAAAADWGIRVLHPALGVNIAYGGYRDISYNVTSDAEPVVLGQFSSLTQHFEPDGFLDYWVAPAAGGLLGRTEANTGDGNFYDNTAPLSSYTVTPLGGNMAQVTLLIPILVDDMGDTLRSTYTGQFLARATVVIPEPSTLALFGVAGVMTLHRRRKRS
jgi:PEP-CTERM motif